MSIQVRVKTGCVVLATLCDYITPSSAATYNPLSSELIGSPTRKRGRPPAVQQLEARREQGPSSSGAAIENPTGKRGRP